ncbi:MAG: 3-hydroxy-2-methylbutyryl-CoA dehydrogenase [Burkholderiales bacterium]|nr:3-hydroxy-2-methylbutyryl-CoA dehydrogenase [Burkholderiales bacterium]
MRASGHIFLITGGASGLGAATVRRLADAGARVVIADLDRDAGERMAQEIGDQARFVRTDVTDEVQVAAAVDAARNHFGALHGAISCAGVAIAERLLGRDGPHRLDSFTRVIDVNLIGTFNVMRFAARAMEKTAPGDGERGVLVNTASISVFEGQVGQVAYSASKAAIVGMTLPAARELARTGIRVMAIAPGVFETPMMAGMSEAVRASLSVQVPFPSRLGQPHEYAALVVHIIENAMLNGEVIRLDGALRMASK